MVIAVGRSEKGDSLIKPEAKDATGGLHAADLDTLAAPAFLAVEDGPSRPADFTLRGESNDALFCLLVVFSAQPLQTPKLIRS